MTQDQSKAKAKRHRDNWKRRAWRLADAARETLEHNRHLADGSICTLFKLREALKQYDDEVTK